MQPKDGQPDWREAEAYAPLLRADRSIFAWEWLRRDPAYRLAAQASLGATAGAAAFAEEAKRAEAWGLHAFERPERPAPFARPVWTTAVHPLVLAAEALDGAPAEDMLDLEALGERLVAVAGPSGASHLLISDGLKTIRLDILVGICFGKACLRYRIGGLASAERPLLTLRRLVAFSREERFSRVLHPSEPKAARWVLLLRTHDALAAGAGQRDIAELLLSGEAREPRWRSRSSSLRSQVQRLVRGARQMSAGAYRALLR